MVPLRSSWLTANVPNANARLKTRGQDVTKPLPATFKVHKRRDRGDMTLTATDSFGNQRIAPLKWVNEDSSIMYGGAAVGTVVFGVGGIASLVTDLYTKSYKGLSDNIIVFDFMSPYAVSLATPAHASAPAQPQAHQTSAQSPDPCPPLQKQGQTKKFVYGP
jgi:hypothetical protein